MFSFIRLSKAWFTLSGIAVLGSIIAILLFGLNLGIDFTGGSLMEVKFDQTIEVSKISEIMKSSELDLGEPVVTPINQEADRAAADTFLIRFRYLETDAEQEQLKSEISKNIGSFTLERFTATGPTLGKSLQVRAIRAIAYASIAIVIYLGATFRNTRRDSLTKYISIGGVLGFMTIIAETMVSSELVRWIVFLAIVALFMIFLIYEIYRKIASLKYGVCAIIALVHDITVTLGVFAILGYFFGVEINSLTVTALLAIMGFSVNDTIVVFDRLRENLKFQKANESLVNVADRSLHQTVARSVNTSVSTLIVLLVLFWLGADSIHWFVGALLVGTVVGTYSSIFTATPILIAWESRRNIK